MQISQFRFEELFLVSIGLPEYLEAMTVIFAVMIWPLSKGS
jgi:hypothetical protein